MGTTACKTITLPLYHSGGQFKIVIYLFYLEIIKGKKQDLMIGNRKSIKLNIYNAISTSKKLVGCL